MHIQLLSNTEFEEVVSNIAEIASALVEIYHDYRKCLGKVLTLPAID